MKKLYCLVSLLFWVGAGMLCCYGNSFRQNLLKNPDFSERGVSKLAKDWEIRCNKPFEVTYDDGLILDTKKAASDITVIQRKLAKGGGKIFSCRVSGNGEYLIYIEYKFVRDGKIASKATPTTQWKKASAQIEEVEIEFVPFEHATDTYLVIQVKGKSAVKFSNLAYIDNPALKNEADNLLRNPLLYRSKVTNKIFGWEVRAQQTDSVKISDTGAITLDAVKNGGIITLLQRELPVGDKKIVSANISGKGKYRIYIEWKTTVNGKSSSASVNTQWKNALEAGEHTTWQFKPVPNTVPYLVIQAGNDSIINISNLKYSEAPEEKPLAALGKFWELNGNSRAINDTDGQVAQLSYVSNYIPGGAIKAIAVTPGKSYELSCDVIGHGISGDSTGYHGFQFRASFPGNPNPIISEWDDVWVNNYQQKRFVFTVPPNVQSCQLDFCTAYKSTVRFRNLTLTPLAESRDPYQIHLISPSFGGNFFSTSPEKFIIAKIDHAKQNTTFKLLKNGKPIKFSIVAPGKEFRFNSENLEVGTYLLQAEIDGVVLNREIQKLPPAKQEVLCVGKKGFLVNGEPFFPICIWSFPHHLASDQGKIFACAAQNGVNLFISGASDSDSIRAILDEAYKNKIMVMLSCKYSDDVSPDGIAKYLQRIENLIHADLRNHPALFGYLIADEPLWAGVPLKKLTETYAALKKLDPYHPVWINSAPRGTVPMHKKYSKAADIYGVDVYPIPYGSHSGIEDKTPSCIGKYVKRMFECVDNNKPIIMALQGFSWGYDKDSSPYPTLTETRFMAYDALTNGAFASFWGLDYVKNTDFFSVIFDATREIEAMKNFFLSGEKIAENQYGSIRCVKYKWRDKTCTIALNASIKSAQADKFQGEKVWFEKRNAGKVENFAPFEVHIYSKYAAPKMRTAPVNEWANIVKKMNSLQMYSGKANWIWDKDTVTQQGGKAVLERKITIDKPIKSAIFFAAADDAAVLLLDGKVFGETAGWSLMLPFDLTEKLSLGIHTIEVQVADAGHLPCGFLAELQLEYQDGTKQIILSDEKYSVKNKNTPAFIVTPYGGGNWSNRVRQVNL